MSSIRYNSHYYEAKVLTNLIRKVLNRRNTTIPLQVPDTIIRQRGSFAIENRVLITLPDLIKVSVLGKHKGLKDLVLPQAITPKKVLRPSQEIKDLHCIIQDLMESKSIVRKKYADDLSQSLRAFETLRVIDLGKEEKIDDVKLYEMIDSAERELREIYMGLHEAFEGFQFKEPRWLQKGGMWPCITATTILETLRSTTSLEFGDGMREMIVEYAVSITALQRLLRMEDAYQNGDRKKLTDEFSNPGHTNWNPRDRPDWLLLEIDANLLIRASQVDVANATISPESGSNAVLQMNMGQGLVYNPNEWCRSE